MTLDDIPQGAFLCTYNGLICSDQTGDSRGVTHGDEYLTELDYIGGWSQQCYVAIAGT